MSCIKLNFRAVSLAKLHVTGPSPCGIYGGCSGSRSGFSECTYISLVSIIPQLLRIHFLYHRRCI